MQQAKRQKPKRPDVRVLKIQPRTRLNKFTERDVPELRFSGNWLRDLGFEFGARVTIICSSGLLIIQPVE